MNLLLLQQKLKTLDEDALSGLHRELVETCTGRPMPDYKEINRQLFILETTDSARGSLLQPLIGTMKGLDPIWFPAARKDRLYLKTTFTYESKPGCAKPEFFIQHPGEALQPVDECAALAHVSQAAGNMAHVHITGCLDKLPTSWAVTIYPPISPEGDVKKTIGRLDADAFWLLSCRNQADGMRILGCLENIPSLSTPLLVNIAEAAGPTAENEKPDFLSHVSFLADTGEAISLVDSLFKRLAMAAKPGPEALIYSIMLSYHNATKIQEQTKQLKKDQATHERFIERFAAEWELLFLNERREAIRDLQLESVAHLMTKLRLLTRNARQAKVAIYAQDQLRPRVRNFLKRVVLEMAEGIKAEAAPEKTSAEVPDMIMRFDDSAMLRSGILHALPSLGLLIPISMINGAEATQATDHLMATTTTHSSGGWLDSLRDWTMEPLTEQLEKSNELLEEAVGVLMASAAGMAIGAAVAGAVASYVVVRGSIVLRETEQMLRELLDETEKTWPRIEDNLRALLPALSGELDQKIVKSAHQVITRIEQL